MAKKKAPAKKAKKKGKFVPFKKGGAGEGNLPPWLNKPGKKK